MTMAVSDIETQDLLKSIDAKLGSIVTIMAKNANVAENSQSAKIAQGFKNLQAPYAEQRKWVGKLCKFWFADAEHPTFGILDFVDAGPHPEPFHIDCGESEQGWYPHCEPVKPDDDIIYKGE